MSAVLERSTVEQFVAKRAVVFLLRCFYGRVKRFINLTLVFSFNSNAFI